MSLLKANSQILYQTHYLQWLETNVEKLRNQNYANSVQILIQELVFLITIVQKLPDVPRAFKG